MSDVTQQKWWSFTFFAEIPCVFKQIKIIALLMCLSLFAQV